MEGMRYGIKGLEGETDYITSTYIGVNGLIQVFNDIIPGHIPVEQLATLHDNNLNRNPYHAAHLNAGFLYAAIDLRGTQRMETDDMLAPFRNRSAISLAQHGRDALRVLVNRSLHQDSRDALRIDGPITTSAVLCRQIARN